MVLSLVAQELSSHATVADAVYQTYKLYDVTVCVVHPCPLGIVKIYFTYTSLS